ncbi:MAG: Esterase/lipase/thioesterase, partial [Frankiales bacterium]|nr:Esterase/lipase/thioesterase [Frankiales bacterium]
LAFQLLIYPVLDGTFSTDSQASHTGAGIVQADMEVYYRCYSGGADRANPLLSPLLVDSTVGLPPAAVITAGFDCLRDEGRLYVDRLRDGGVEAELHHYPDAAHGFLSVPGLSSQARPALDAAAAALCSALSGASA